MLIKDLKILVDNYYNNDPNMEVFGSIPEDDATGYRKIECVGTVRKIGEMIFESEVRAKRFDMEEDYQAALLVLMIDLGGKK